MQKTLIILVFGLLSFLTGYKLRHLIPENRRITVGFFGMVVFCSLILGDIMFSKIIKSSYISFIAMQIGQGFFLGISQKESNKPTTEKNS